MTSREWYTPPEIARMIRVRQSRILADIRAGRLRAIDVSDNARHRYRVRAADLDAYLQARAVHPVTRPARRSQEDPTIPNYVRGQA